MCTLPLTLPQPLNVYIAFNPPPANERVDCFWPSTCQECAPPQPARMCTWLLTLPPAKECVHCFWPSTCQECAPPFPPPSPPECVHGFQLSPCQRKCRLILLSPNQRCTTAVVYYMCESRTKYKLDKGILITESHQKIEVKMQAGHRMTFLASDAKSSWHRNSI